jgi:hypothetical protein
LDGKLVISGTAGVTIRNCAKFFLLLAVTVAALAPKPRLVRQGRDADPQPGGLGIQIAKGKGFKLSLRGYPEFDYRALIQDLSGRRFGTARLRRC